MGGYSCFVDTDSAESSSGSIPTAVSLEDSNISAFLMEIENTMAQKKSQDEAGISTTTRALVYQCNMLPWYQKHLMQLHLRNLGRRARLYDPEDMSNLRPSEEKHRKPIGIIPIETNSNDLEPDLVPSQTNNKEEPSSRTDEQQEEVCLKAVKIASETASCDDVRDDSNSNRVAPLNLLNINMINKETSMSSNSNSSTYGSFGDGDESDEVCDKKSPRKYSFLDWTVVHNLLGFKKDKQSLKKRPSTTRTLKTETSSDSVSSLDVFKGTLDSPTNDADRDSPEGPRGVLEPIQPCSKKATDVWYTRDPTKEPSSEWSMVIVSFDKESGTFQRTTVSSSS